MTNKIKTALSGLKKSRKRKITTFVFLLFLSFMTLASDDVRTAFACDCDPWIFTTNFNLFGQLFKELTVDVFVRQMKGLLAEKLSYEYLTGNMLGPIVGQTALGSSGSVNVDFTDTVKNGLDAGVTDMKAYIDKNITPATYMDYMNPRLIEAAREALEGTTPPYAGDINDFLQAYSNFLYSPTAYNTYKDEIKAYHDALLEQANTSLAYCLQTVNLSGLMDVNDTVLDAYKDNVKVMVDECYKSFSDGFNAVGDIYGSGLELYITHYFIEVNNKFIGEYLSGDNSISASGAVTGATDKEAIKDATGYVSETVADLEKIAGTATAKLLSDMDAALDNAVKQVNAITEADKGSAAEFSVQMGYEQQLADIESTESRPADASKAWHDAVSMQRVQPGDIKSVAALIAGPTPPDIERIMLTKNYIIAQEAYDVATRMKKRLSDSVKDFAQWDSSVVDRVWKDIARLSYYSFTLMNEKMKMEAMSAMTEAVFFDGSPGREVQKQAEKDFSSGGQ